MSNVKIISVEAKKSYYAVITSVDDYKFDEDTIIKYGIFNDAEFDKKEFEKIVKDNENTMAFSKVIRYLGYGPRSKLEIIKYLKEKGVDNYKPVLKRLLDGGYINDERLAYDVCEYYKSCYKGPMYIRKKLDEKGIDEDLITKAMLEYTASEEEENCMIVASKEVANLSTYPIKKQQTSLYTKLVSKGYKRDTIIHTLEKIEFVDESSERLRKDYERLVNKVANKEMSDSEKRSYIIEHLMAKGYEYKKIKEII